MEMIKPIDVTLDGIRVCSVCGKSDIDELLAGLPFAGFWVNDNNTLCECCMRKESQSCQ